MTACNATPWQFYPSVRLIHEWIVRQVVQLSQKARAGGGLVLAKSRVKIKVLWQGGHGER